MNSRNILFGIQLHRVIEFVGICPKSKRPLDFRMLYFRVGFHGSSSSRYFVEDHAHAAHCAHHDAGSVFVPWILRIRD